jgi:hypothetical protein
MAADIKDSRRPKTVARWILNIMSLVPDESAATTAARAIMKSLNVPAIRFAFAEF